MEIYEFHDFHYSVSKQLIFHDFRDSVVEFHEFNDFRYSGFDLIFLFDFHDSDM